MKICESLKDINAYKSRLVITDSPLKIEYIMGGRFTLKTKENWKTLFCSELKMDFTEPCVYILHTESEYTVVLYVPNGFNRHPCPFNLELQEENESSLLLWRGLSRLTSYSITLPRIPLSDIFDIYLSSIQCAFINVVQQFVDIPLIKNQLSVHPGNFHFDFPFISLGKNMSTQFSPEVFDFSCQHLPQVQSIGTFTLPYDSGVVKSIERKLQRSQFKLIKMQLMKNKSQLDLVQQKVVMKEIMQTAMTFVKDLINYREQRVNALEQILMLRNQEIAELNEKNKMLSKINANTNFVSKQLVKLSHQMEDDKEEDKIDQQIQVSELKKLILHQSSSINNIVEDKLRVMIEQFNQNEQFIELNQQISHQNQRYSKLFNDLDKHIQSAIKPQDQDISNKIDSLIRLTRSYEIEKVKYAEALKDMEQVQLDRNRLCQENDDFEQQINELTKELDDKNQELTLKSNSFNLMSTEVYKLKKQKKNLENELSSVRNELRLEKEDRDTLEDSSNTLVKRNRQIIEKYRNELESIKKLNNELEEEKYENQLQLEEYRQKMKMMGKQQQPHNTMHMDEIERLKDLLRDADLQKLQLKRENDELSDKLMLMDKKSGIKSTDIDSAITVRKRKRKNQYIEPEEHDLPKITKKETRIPLAFKVV